MNDLTNATQSSTSTHATADAALPVVRPAADVIEREDAYIVTLDLPGAKESSIELRHERSVLSVQATRQRPEPAAGRLVRAEFGSVRFARAFRLPPDNTVDASRIGARYACGVLEVTLPKSAAAQPRRIEVK